MKKFWIIILTFISIQAMAQMEVKEGSFKIIPDFIMTDKDSHYDGNGEEMALIKITTENISAEDRNKFYFKGNLATDFDVVPKIGELYVYLSAEAATFIEIKHPDFGKCTIDIMEMLGESLADFCAYEMVIVSNYKPDTEALPKYNYLVINTDQDDAMIYINDELIGLKDASSLLSVDTTHTWRIECDLHETESGEVTIPVGDPIVISKELKPNYGYVDVVTNPEDSALVIIDSKIVGVTPYQSDRIKTGKHDIVIMKENFKNVIQTFETDSAYTTYLDIDMEYSVVNVSVYADSLSKIYVDNKYKGDVTWSGILNEGIHLFEARKENHKAAFIEKELFIGADEIIELDKPEPIFSSIDIQTNPDEVDVYIDGEHYGKTQHKRLFIDKILIGQHEIRFEKDGYAMSIGIINVEESETLTISEILTEGYLVKIETDSIGDKVYVDEQYIGKSPIENYFTVGMHTARIERGSYRVEEDFNVSDDNDNRVEMFFGKNILIESDMEKDIIFVNDQYVGTSPHTVNLPYGRYKIDVVRKGKDKLIIADSVRITRNIVVNNDSESSIKIPVGKEVAIMTTDDRSRFYVNKQEVGKKTPSVTMYLPFGEHDVRLKSGRKEIKEKIVVKERGGEDVFNIYYGQLVIFDSDKEGDVVKIDGKKVGRTPLEMDVPYGDYKVKVKRHRKFHERNISVDKNDNISYFSFTPKRHRFSDFIDNGVRYFVLNASMSSERQSSYSYGLSFGSYRQIGWFLSGMTNFDVVDNMYCTGITQLLLNFKSYIDNSSETISDKTIDSRLAVIGGLLVKTFGPVYLKFGAGYGLYSTYLQTVNENWHLDEEKSYEGLLLTGGLQFNLKNLIISAEVVTPPDFKALEFKVGLGLGWKKK